MRKSSTLFPKVVLGVHLPAPDLEFPFEFRDTATRDEVVRLLTARRAYHEQWAQEPGHDLNHKTEVEHKMTGTIRFRLCRALLEDSQKYALVN